MVGSSAPGPRGRPSSRPRGHCAAHRQDGGEGSKRHHHVDRHIDDDALRALDRAGRETDQRVSHMADRGIGHQPFEVALADGGEGAKHHRGDRDEGEDLAPVVGDAGKGGDHDPNQDRHRGDLGRGGEERRHRSRRALVDVGRPHMKRHDGNLERQPHQNEHQPEQHADARMIMHGVRNRAEGDRAGIAVDQRHPVEHHARRQGAEDEIFEAGFRRAQVMAAIGRDHVERQAHQLETEVERDEVIGRDQHQHAEGGNEDEDREFEPADPLLTHELDRQQKRHQRADQRKRAHEAGEGVVGEGAVEGDAHRAIPGHHQNEDEAEQADGDLVDEGRPPLAAQGAIKHERQGPRRQHRLRQDHGKRNGRLVHECRSFQRQSTRGAEPQTVIAPPTSSP